MAFKHDTLSVRRSTLSIGHPMGVRGPLYASTSNEYLDVAEDYYPRHGNLPNQRAVAEKMASLEQGEDAIVLGSGMSAIVSSLTSLLEPGAHLVVQKPLYSGAMRFITKYLPRLGVSFTFVKGLSAAEFRAAIQPNTKALYLESPTNPLLSLIDIRAVVTVAQQASLLTIFDNTLATPINQTPLVMGVDLVIHSATKFLGGHGDLSGGVVVGRKQVIERVREYIHDVGGMLDPNICYLLERSLLTLSVRIEKINSNALQLATFLNSHPRIVSVRYPGLPTHPDYAIAQAQMRGFGGVVSFVLDDTIDPIRFQKSLQLIGSANSLGEVMTTLNSPCLASSSFINLGDRQRVESGISNQLIRMSVGIESSEDLMHDLDTTLRNA